MPTCPLAWQSHSHLLAATTALSCISLTISAVSLKASNHDAIVFHEMSSVTLSLYMVHSSYESPVVSM